MRARERLLLGAACAVAMLTASACNGPPPGPDGGQDAGTDGPVDARRHPHAPRDASESGDAGIPSLTELRVSFPPGTDAASPAELVPPFAPDVFDYYVRCAAGPNAWTVSMKASPGATTLLAQPTSSPSLPSQTLSLSVLENQAVVVFATDGNQTTEYWVRCLPHDMPTWTWSRRADAAAPTPGYYLVGNFYSSAGEDGYAMALDRNGVPVWYARAPAGGAADDVESLSPGTISFNPYAAHIKGTPFEVRTLSPPSTTFVAPTTYVPSLHELRVLPGGDYLILAAPLVTNVDFKGREANLLDGGKAALGSKEAMLDCTVVEFTPDGAVVWTWSASDHFGPDALLWLQPAFGGGVAPDGGILLDGFHCNSIDVDPATGDLLVSARDMDSIFLVDRKTGAVRWKMGGARSSLDDAGYVSVTDPFHRQHDARLQPGWASDCHGGEGRISVFDDESYIPGAVARGVLYDVVVGDAGGGVAVGCDGGLPEGGNGATATVAWQYKGAVTSSLGGSFRISADGSRVIDWGVGGAPRLVFTEVDVARKDVLELSFEASESSYRAIKMPLGVLDLDAMRSSAGLP